MKKTKQNTENHEEKSTKEIHTSNRVGFLLKKRREEKKLSLKKVSKHLCIREDFLNAIEEGIKKDLPERVYTLGFIRSYAHYLDLDEQAVLIEYNKEYKETGFSPQYVFPEPLPQKGVPSFLNYGIALIILTLGLALWIFVKNPFISQNDPRSAEDTPNQPANLTPQKMNSLSPTPSVAISVLAPDPGISSTFAPGADPIPDANPIPDTAPVLTIAPMEDNSSNNVDSSPDLEVKIVSESEPSPSQDHLPSLAEDPNIPSFIRLHAKEKVWVQLKDQTETPILTKTMLPEESYTLPYSEELLLTVGNAGGLQIFIDEKETSPLGLSGQVKRNISLKDLKTS